MHALRKLCLGLVVCLAGCAEFDLKKNIPWGAGSDGKLERPMKVVANWTPAVMNSGGGQPVRGFGGRMLFYANESGKPVKVAGTLSVYAFDDTDGLKDDAAPEKKFVFTEEQFAQHHSKKGMLGHSYSFWIPWDELGGEQRDISLLCRFVASQGDVVMSEQVKLILPGKPPKKPVPDTLAADDPGVNVAGAVQQASYEAAANSRPAQGAEESRRRMTTKTIDVPSGANHFVPRAKVLDVRSAVDSADSAAALAPAAAMESGTARPALSMPESPARPLLQRREASLPRTGRFGPAKFPVPAGQVAPPMLGHDRWQQHRSGWQSDQSLPPAAYSGPANAENRAAMFPY